MRSNGSSNQKYQSKDPLIRPNISLIKSTIQEIIQIKVIENRKVDVGKMSSTIAGTSANNGILSDKKNSTNKIIKGATCNIMKRSPTVSIIYKFLFIQI